MRDYLYIKEWATHYTPFIKDRPVLWGLSDNLKLSDKFDCSIIFQIEDTGEIELRKRCCALDMPKSFTPKEWIDLLPDFWTRAASVYGAKTLILAKRKYA